MSLIKGGLTVFVSVVIISAVVRAGSLTPSSTPASDGYTLENVYTRLTTNGTSISGDFSMDPSGSPAGTQYTLDQIYSAIPTIVTNTVKLGTSYLGVDGTLVPDGTATGADCLDTKTFYSGDSWTQKTGSLATQTLSVANDTLSAGNYNATTLSAVDTDLATGNIKSGINIFGIDGDGNVVDTSSGNAIVADLFDSKISWVDGSSITGSLDLACNTATFDGTGNIVANTYDGAGDGTNRWCMTDTGDVTASQMKTGSIAWVDGLAVTGSGTQTLSNATTTLSAGYYEATTLDSVDIDLTAANILSGKTIFGISGTVYGDTNQAQVLTTATGAGTYNASNLTVDTVKSGTSFGVSSTGDYPSTTYPLSGDTGVTDATATEICNTNEAWTKAGSLITGTLNPTASTIGVGNTYCGIAGTLLANLDNGSATSGDYPQSVGGVDDYNNNGAMPGDSYTSTWTTCDAGNSYCSTGDATNADKKDESTGLVWSIWLASGATSNWFSANNCQYPNGLPGDDGTCDTNGEVACKCVKLTSSKTGCEALGDGNWRLPSQKESMQAYIDGSWGNLSSAGYSYWSATTKSYSTYGAWYTTLYYGRTNDTNKTNLIRSRCVR